MARHLGLGNKGLDAFIDGSTGFEFDTASGSVDSASPSLNTGSADAAVVSSGSSKRKLPEGITADEDGTLWVNPALLKPNPHQPRQYFDENKLAELTESVKKEGILSPVIIEDAEDGTFYIIAGERRTRAARAAGLEKVPVQLRKYSDSRKLEVALVENIQRTDLNPIEEAEAYLQIMQLEGITQEQVAERVGKSRSSVANTMRLLKLPEDIRQSLASGSLSSGHARALLSVADPASQKMLFRRITTQGLSVRQAEKQAGDLNKGGLGDKSGKENVALQNRDPNYADLEQKLIEALGTKVQLRGNWNKGTVVIDYFTKDDLDRIYNRIVAE